MIIKCASCLNIVKTKPSRVKNGQKFCSRKCQFFISKDKRFMSKVEKTINCWLWTGSKDNAGYGLFSGGGKTTVRAHRFSFELFNNKIPKGAIVRHRCDSPSCVNPRHLETGNSKDNAEDRESRGRTARGFRIPRTKLSMSNIIDIRERYKSRRFTQKELAKIFGITDRYVWDIINNKNRTKGEDMYYQQGDVILIKVGVIPGDAKKNENFDGVLQHGEKTGHRHRVTGTSLELYELFSEGRRYLRAKEESKIDHQEHNEFKIEPGDYEIRIVREVDHFSELVRPVAD